MENKIRFRFIGYAILGLKASLVALLLYKIFYTETHFSFALDEQFAYFVLAGFLAQLIDGTLGMAYGVSCTTLLLNFGVSPAVATASIHTAEVFTTGMSGLSHLYLGNVNKNLFIRLVIPGVVGSILGAYLISEVFDGKVIRPYISAYLLLLGVIILWKSFGNVQKFDGLKYLSPLGFVGGLLDAIGGGGWGPIVASNVINQGNCPKETVGTVNTAEFFVAFFSTGVFLYFIGIDSWKIILGLILGGIAAAPIGAFLANKLKPKSIMFLVGTVIIITSLYNIYTATF